MDENENNVDGVQFTPGAPVAPETPAEETETPVETPAEDAPADVPVEGTEDPVI